MAQGGRILIGKESRARCPRFRDRCCYRGRVYIHCGTSRLRFCRAEERDEYYRGYCCGVYGRCQKYREGEA